MTKKRRSGLVPWEVRVRRFTDPLGHGDGLVFTLVGCEPPGPNGPGGFLQQHWARRKKDKDLLALLMRAGLNSSPDKPIQFKGKVTIAYERSYRTQEMDPDNLVASAKPLLDALQRLGTIENDTPKHVRLLPTQRKRTSEGPVTRLSIFPDGLPTT